MSKDENSAKKSKIPNTKTPQSQQPPPPPKALKIEIDVNSKSFLSKSAAVSDRNGGDSMVPPKKLGDPKKYYKWGKMTKGKCMTTEELEKLKKEMAEERKKDEQQPAKKCSIT